MIINKVIINNYGIYYKENIFDFSINEENKNIILIGGKNGSGKTTLLESIKIAIYGCLFYGLKSPNKKYFEYIYRKFNTKALNENISEASVEIDFLWKENNNLDNYRIKRFWILENIEEFKIKEDINISKNNIELNPKEIEDIGNYFRKIFPQRMFDFFFFDGEDTQKLITGDYLEGEEFKNAIYTLFNMDIFKSLEMDLGFYIKNRSRSNNLLKEEIELENKLTEQKELIFKKDNFEKIITEEKIKKEENVLEREKLNVSLKNIGGSIFDKGREYDNNIQKLLNERHQITESFKSELGSYIPFLINKERLNLVFKQIEKERSSQEFEIINQRLNDGTFNNVLKNTFSIIDNNTLSSFKKNLLDVFKKENVKIIHNISYDNYEKVNKVLEKINGNYKNTIENDLLKQKDINDKLEILRNEINTVRNNTEIESIQKEISNITINVENNVAMISKTEEILQIELNKLLQIEKEIKILKEKIIDIKKNENKFLIVDKIQTILNQYTNIKNKEKLKLVETYFIDIFNKLHRKKGFIKDIKINSETLDIKLFHELGLFNNNLLSTGEKQIYILTVLLSFLKASGKEFPLIFDTLLGRLDTEHRINIIQEYLPIASKQVIILSTNSEITKENYDLLKPFIAKEYTINYNIDKKQVELINEYFIYGNENEF